MPEIHVVLYRETNGSVPTQEWLNRLNRRARAKCRWLIECLQAQGHECRRPQADYLRDGIYELRTRIGNVRYRMLYFFHGNVAAVISHGMIKKMTEVPPGNRKSNETEKAVRAKSRATYTGN